MAKQDVDNGRAQVVKLNDGLQQSESLVATLQKEILSLKLNCDELSAACKTLSMGRDRIVSIWQTKSLSLNDSLKNLHKSHLELAEKSRHDLNVLANLFFGFVST